jgi:PAS domain S-box-containing protein
MKRFRYDSLGLRKQLILLIFIIFMPILALLLFTGYKQHQHALAEIEKTSNQLIRVFVEEQLNIVNQTRHFLGVLAHVPAVRNLDLAECNPFLKSIHQENPQYSTIVVASSEGVIDCSAIPLKQPIDVKDRSWFQRITESREFVIDHFIISRSAQKASLPFAFPVLNSEKKLMVAVGAAYDLEHYQEIFKKILLPRDSVILVMDKNEVVIHESVSKEQCFGKHLLECKYFGIPDYRKGSFDFKDTNGMERIYWFERLSVGQESNEIIILVGVSKQEIYLSAKHVLITNVSLMIVLASLCLGMAWFFGKKIILDPVNFLVNKIQRVQKGDLSSSNRVSVLSGDFRILAQAFDDMLNNLSKREVERDGALDALKKEIIEHKETLATLREKETHLRILFEQAADAIFVSNLNGTLTKVNKQACQSTGYTENEILKLKVSDIDVETSSSESFHEFAKNLSPDHPITIESAHRRKDGSVFPVEITIAFLQTHGGPQLLGIARDISDRKRAEKVLRESERRLRLMVENLPAGAVYVENDSEATWLNAEAERITGYARSELSTTTDWFNLLYGLDAARIRGYYDHDRIAGFPAPRVVSLRRKDGMTRDIEFVAYHHERGDIWLMHDITERRQAEMALRTSLEEKTALLKEVHHRVKNNLQIVTSLLNLQARQIQNPDALAVLQDTQGRIRSMALLHESLYREGHWGWVDGSAYLSHLCAHLNSAFGAATGRVRLRCQLAPVALGLDQAVPCGLIVNELVSNAFKHAFPGERRGEICVELHTEPDGRLTLAVIDDGVGLPPGLNLGQSETLGWQLVAGLAQQLGGSVEIRTDIGTAFHITLPASRSSEVSL